VDDHPEVLKSLARLLAFDFDVVGAAANAHEALEISQRARPDIVVMDISMPGRDGFQTAGDLKESGSTAPVVFLTMHESEDFVAAGFRSGGRGYVLKTRLHEDLVPALERVLAGQVFIPSLNSLYVLDENPRAHAVLFHTDDRAYIATLATFVNKGLRRGDAVSAVLTEPRRIGLAARLQAYGWNVGESGIYGRYQTTDSAEVATAILRDGLLDAERVSEMIAEVERFRVATAGPSSRMIVVGDIAGHFFARGNLTAVMALERRWNHVTHPLPFLTVCCYTLTTFSDDTHGHLFPHLCAEHHAVAHGPEGGMRSLSI
jgi:DNA-binding NarL/FixJ family response regulator